MNAGSIGLLLVGVKLVEGEVAGCPWLHPELCVVRASATLTATLTLTIHFYILYLVAPWLASTT